MEPTSFDFELLPIGPAKAAKPTAPAKPAAPEAKEPAFELDLLPMGQVTATRSPAPVKPAPSEDPAPAVLELDLLPIGTAPAARPPAPPKPATAGEPGLAATLDDAADPAATDRFLKEATSQYIEGHIDQPLWDRALAQANGDKDAATPIYLRARATALRVLHRDMRAKDRAAMRADDQRNTDTRPRQRQALASEGAIPARPAARLTRKHMVAMAGMLLAVVVGVVLFAIMQRSPEPVAAPVAARPKPAPVAKAPEAPAAPAASSQAVTAEFMAKITELREARNWNVLVLYATEWTRRDPQSVAAWTQLSAAFANLKQFADAKSAAAQVVKLAPIDPQGWRSLGQLNMTLNRPEEAIPAYESAAGLDERDAESRVQIAILQTRLGHFPEAQAAIDKALALVPDDPQAQCLKTLIVQRSHAPRDRNATTTPTKADAACGELVDPPAPVAVAEPVAAKPAQPARPRR